MLQFLVSELSIEGGMDGPSAGTLIAGKYRVLSLLGEGAMGVVHRAAQLDAEGQPLREVAVKLLLPALSGDPRFIQRFLREVRVAAKLNSAHIVTFFDAGQTPEGQLYYVMELVRGPTLKEVLKSEGTLSSQRAVGIAGQICDVLGEAHGLPEPVVHRDLKPGNMFIESRREEDWVKVGDFGIAKIFGEKTGEVTQAGISMGTPRYMAPEQWAGQQVDGRADLYSLGIVMYEMLAGHPPFSDAEGTMSLMYQQLHEPPPPLPLTIPTRLRVLVKKLLGKHPGERPPDGASVRAALATALEEDDGPKTMIIDIAANARSISTARPKHESDDGGVEARGAFRPRAPDEAPEESGERKRGSPLGYAALMVLGAAALAAGGYWIRLQAAPDQQSDEMISPAARPDDTARKAEEARREAERIERAKHEEAARAEAARKEDEIRTQREEDARQEEASRGETAKREEVARAEAVEREESARAEAAQKAEAARREEEARKAKIGRRDEAARAEEARRQRELAAAEEAARTNQAARREEIVRREDAPPASAIHPPGGAPFNADEYNMRGLASRRRGDLDGAIADYSEAIRRDPRNADAYGNRGAARFQKRDYDGAIADCTAALSLDPQNEDAYITRGAARFQKRDYTGAIADCTEALRIEPRNAEAFMNRGAARYQSNDSAGAIGDYTKALEVAPAGWPLRAEAERHLRDLKSARR
jgi:serine/threonine protein kinase/tetratricopeptide (TPR) repeat protein